MEMKDLDPKEKGLRGRMGGKPQRALKPTPPPIMAEHTVAAGETLGDISLKYYGSAVKDKYMLIYEANTAAIGDNPNVIKPGTVLKIPKI